MIRKIASILLVLVIAFAIYIFTSNSTKINISKNTIDNQISKKLPIHKEVKIPMVKGVSVDITKIETNFDNNITFQISGKINKNDNSVDFISSGHGELYYKNEAFYFKPTEINIEYDTNPAKLLEAKLTDNKGLSRFIPKSIKKSILDSKDVHSAINKKVNSVIESGIVKYLDKNKVYAFKEGSIMKLAVKSVFVEPNQVTVEISLLEVTKSILFKVFGFIALIGGLILIIMYPGAFVGLFALDFLS